MSGSLTRVSIFGSLHHVDVVVPSDEPVSGLLPQLLNLTQEPSTFHNPPKVLTTDLGQPLPTDRSLAQSGVLDGAILRLRPFNDTPPDAVVFDVSAVASTQTDNSAWRWTAHWRSVTLPAIMAILLAGAAIVGLGSLGGGLAQIMLLVASSILLILGVLMATAFSNRRIGLGIIGAGTASAAWTFAVMDTTNDALLPFLGLVAVAIATAVALALASSHKTLFLGCAISLALLAGIFALVFLVSRDVALGAGTTGIVAAVGLGLAARLATQLSGLAGLDDDQRRGAAIRQGTTEQAIGRAHQNLALLTTVCSVALSLAVAALSTDRGREPWSIPLAAVLLAILVLRTQSLPLIFERVVGYTAASATAVAAIALFATRWSAPALALVLVALAAFVAAGAMARVRDASAARLRISASRAETFMVLATVPLLLGLGGLFSQLVKSFG